jgi:hypothetical protein
MNFIFESKTSLGVRTTKKSHRWRWRRICRSPRPCSLLGRLSKLVWCFRTLARAPRSSPGAVPSFIATAPSRRARWPCGRWVRNRRLPAWTLPSAQAEVSMLLCCARITARLTSASGERGLCVFQSRPEILFCKLRLEAGQISTCKKSCVCEWWAWKKGGGGGGVGGGGGA